MDHSVLVSVRDPVAAEGHFAGMANEAETGNVGTAVNREAAQRFSGGFV